MLNEKLAYEELKKQYHYVLMKSEKQKYMPIKEVFVIGKINGVATITGTHMEGTTLNGLKVKKHIIVDDEESKTYEDVFLYDAIGKMIDEHHDDNFTPIRCGLMTCIAIEEACKLLKLPCKNLSVGFIGNGNINQHNARAIQSIFGLKRCIIHGSANNRGKNKDKFYKAEVDHNCELLNECDVIVSCTSGCDGKDMISADILYKPKIMIALDSGYVLDESFRKECDSFTDYVEQLERYYDEEFTFDKKRYKLKQLCKDIQVEKSRLCVYLFGIGFADAVVAETMYNKKRLIDYEKQIHKN